MRPALTHTTFCRICESLCGLVVEVEERPRREDPAPTTPTSRPGASPARRGCGSTRSTPRPIGCWRPEKRTGDRWERVGWDRALGEIGAKVRQLRARPRPGQHRHVRGDGGGLRRAPPGLRPGVHDRASAPGRCTRRRPRTAPTSSPWPARSTASPSPSPSRTWSGSACLVIVGANPVISKWSFLQVPNPARALQAIEARGGRVFVVDPRRTETARAAGEHVFIRPDTDVFFYLSFLRELLAGGVDEARVGALRAGARRGAGAVRALDAGAHRRGHAHPPGEAAGDGGGLPDRRRRGALLLDRRQHGLERVARLLAPGGRRTASPGNLDRPGGTLVGHGVIDFAAFGKKTGTLLRNDRSRIGDFLSVNDGFPGGILADEILTPGDRQVRALFVTGGNPLITMANAGRLREAFEKLELLVTLDLFKNETGSLAHYVLPCTSPLERPDLPFIFPLMLGLQERPYLQATDAILPPPGRRPGRGHHLPRPRAGRAGSRSSAPASPRGSSQAMKAALASPPGRSRPCPRSCCSRPSSGPRGRGRSGALLRAAAREAPRAPPGRATSWATRVVTDDRLVDLAPPRPARAGAEARGATSSGRSGTPDQLKLITRRAVATHNSWTHNIEPFAAPGTNLLYVHPDDAARLGLADGALADVSTRVATVRASGQVPPRPHARHGGAAPRVGAPARRRASRSRHGRAA